jgi:hypothetical protein
MNMPTVGETEQRQCMVEVTEADRVLFGANMAEHEVAIEVLKAERGALSARIREHEKERNRLGHILDNGKHEQPLECWWRRDEAAREWYLQRPDTGETIETRPFATRDMTYELPFAAADDSDADAQPVEVIGAPVDSPVNLEVDDPAPANLEAASLDGQTAAVVSLPRPPRRPAPVANGHSKASRTRKH